MATKRESRASDDRNSTRPLKPLAVRIPTAVRLTGLGRTKLYELIGAGRLERVKVGSATLITYRSLEQLIASQVRCERDQPIEATLIRTRSPST